MLCLGHGLRVVHPAREKIRTGAPRKAAARRGHRPQCAAAYSTPGAYAAGRCLVSGLRLLCVTSNLVSPCCFLSRFCSSMGSPQRLHQIISGNVLSGRIAPPCWLSDLWTLWWQPFIRFHQGGTAMDLRYRITAWALLYSSPCPVVDNLKSKLHPRSKVPLNG